MPGEKIIISEFRCNDIKKEALQQVKEEIAALKRTAAKTIIPDFADQCAEIYGKARDHYDSIAVQYSKEVYEKIREEMKVYLHDEFKGAFTRQIRSLVQ